MGLFKSEEEKRKERIRQERIKSAIGRAVAIACQVAEAETPGWVKVSRLPQVISGYAFSVGYREGAWVRDADANHVSVRIVLDCHEVLIDLYRLQVYEEINKWEVRAHLTTIGRHGKRMHRGTWKSVGVRQRLFRESTVFGV